MYRCIFRLSRTSSVSLYESRLLAAKCDTAAAPVYRSVNAVGVKPLSTSSFRFCEKKDDVAPSTQDEKTNAEKQPESTETPTLSKEKPEEDGVVLATEQREEPVVLNTDGGGTDVITEQEAAKPVQKTTDGAKSGKESLLQLLGAMKVEVTSKRRPRNLKENKSSDFTPKPTLASMESTMNMFQKAKEEASSHSKTLDPELVAAASAAAATLPERSIAESQLLQQLRKHESIAEAQRKGDVNHLGNLINAMKIGKRRKSRDVPDHIRFDEDGHGYTKDRKITAKIDSTWRKKHSERLNIFSPATAEETQDSAVARPTLWDLDFAQQLSEGLDLRPRNMFEEMIDWTKEGKMWQYPIDNEAGLEEEASVPFHEHVFLGKHLQEGFPRQGPVRHFMELVVVGLSRNPYLSVQQKKEHIDWFRDYFQQKEDVLKEAEVHLN